MLFRGAKFSAKPFEKRVLKGQKKDMSVVCELCLRLQSRAPYSRFFVNVASSSKKKNKVEISKL